MNFRYELKFRLNQNELADAVYIIKNLNASRQYITRKVNSIYFDTLDFRCAKDNLIGIPDRYKIRIRWYNDDISKLQLEIKYKKGRLGAKQIFLIENSNEINLENLKSSHFVKNLFRNIVKKNGYIKELSSNLFPVVLVNYEREYFGLENGLRITLDKNIKIGDLNTNRNLHDIKHYSITNNILEFKFDQNIMDSIPSILKNCRLTATRNSKYLAALAKLGYISYI